MQGLSPQTIKVYLSGIRHMQITIGFQELKEFSSMPRLKLVQSGIQRYTSKQQTGTVNPLPLQYCIGFVTTSSPDWRIQI